MGGELVPFSPITDGALPENIDGLYLGGGYPALYAKELGENASMRASVRAALERGVPCIAECGGFMYLTDALGDEPIARYQPGPCYATGQQTHFHFYSNLVFLYSFYDACIKEKHRHDGKH